MYHKFRQWAVFADCKIGERVSPNLSDDICGFDAGVWEKQAVRDVLVVFSEPESYLKNSLWLLRKWISVVLDK